MSADLQAPSRRTAPSPFGAVLAKDLRDRALPALGIGLALGALSFFVLGLYSGLAETFDRFTAGLPEALQAFISSDAPGGYVVAELFELIAPLTLVAYAILTGASTVAGEEEAGTMGLLVAHPVARRSVLAAKVTGLVTALVAAASLLLAGVAVGSWTYGIGLEPGGILAACLHMVLLATAFGLLSLAIGAATGRPGTATASAGGLAVFAYLAEAMLPFVGLDAWARISPWHYYSGADPLAHGIHAGHLLVLAGLAALALALAVTAFDRRDLRG